MVVKMEKYDRNKYIVVHHLYLESIFNSDNCEEYKVFVIRKEDRDLKVGDWVKYRTECRGGDIIYNGDLYEITSILTDEKFSYNGTIGISVSRLFPHNEWEECHIPRSKKLHRRNK